MMLKEKVIEAYEFSKEKHGAQMRKFSGLPYFSHPKEVARIIENLTSDEDLIITALLHDTLEDTDTTYEEIKDRFGKKIADLVVELTSDDKKSIKRFGKGLYLGMKMSTMTTEALIVKLADRFHNVKYLEGDDVPAKFIKKYYHETWIILGPIENSDIMMKLHPLNDVRDLLIERIKIILKFLKIRYFTDGVNGR